VIPWIIVAVIVVPLLVVAFVVMRRNTAATEHAGTEDEAELARTEGEFAEAEAFEAKWHEEDKKRYQQERLP
jgi:flagellar basal body-associated protein FliL